MYLKTGFLIMYTKVTLRKKTITGNRESLYLDFYPPIANPKTGKETRREFLNCFVYSKPKNSAEKLHNAEIEKWATEKRLTREVEVNRSNIYGAWEAEQLRIQELGQLDFVTYFLKLVRERKGTNHDNWVSASKYLVAYTGGSLKFADLNEGWAEDFKKHLLTTKSNKSDKVTLSRNSAVSYFNKLKAALKQAYKDGFLREDLNAKIDSIKGKETRREFLTLEELNQLAKTHCNNPLLKRAALFSALTGLRFSDIKNLVWGDIEHVKGEGYFINFTQQKTEGVEVLPISEQAADLLGERGEAAKKVFPDLTYTAYQNKHLYQWIGAAGITKNITFHCFRHTYATLLLSNGTDLYTVSKMLGHRDLKTTQIYAKVIDKVKREASNVIKIDLPK